jgi:Ca2+-binding EF-hand superfamily protein
MVMQESEIEQLWSAFSVFDADGNGSISAQELGEVMRSLGQNPTPAQVRQLIQEVDTNRSGTIDFEEFKALMIGRQGDRISRLKLAFSVFDRDQTGHITKAELQQIMHQFDLSDAELDEMIHEVDEDGDGVIGFEEFCRLVPAEEVASGYVDSPRSQSLAAPPPGTPEMTPAPVTPTESTPPSPVASAAQSSVPDSAAFTTELAQLQALLAQHPQGEKIQGTSRLQMQIALFRLIQGAAYRCFRESFSANHETHLKVKNLPYRISEFVPFVQTAIALYKALGIVEAACYPLLDAVAQSISDEYAYLQDRIQHWATLPKTPEMVAEEQAMLEARSQSVNAREKFVAGVEFAITLKKQKLSLGDVVEGVLALKELNRLREQDLEAELVPPAPETSGKPEDYLKKWNRVILSSALEIVDGAMMPVAYWYEDFMPKLLAAFSVSTAADVTPNTVPDEAALNQWYEETRASGEFDRYGIDVATHFLDCTPAQKLAVQQAWRLTHHYLNGVQKRRERLEFGRESGVLSQYIAFIDVYLHRSDIRDAQMRVSFPYYLGPAVWRFFHTTAEIVALQSPEQQTAEIALFKDFFKGFATMYPCPYCRHHLNAYVVQNREVDMYPVEYLLLGRTPQDTDFQMSIDDKLATVTDGHSLRLFFWKLHNTVSSSIARSEEWYQRDDRAFYTTRYWPSVDSELARAQAIRHISIATNRIYRIYGLLRPVARLAGVRLELQRLLDKGNIESLTQACELAQAYIHELESAVIEGGFLQEVYRFEPDLVDKSPAFTPEEEAFGRSGLFVEV